MSKKFQKKVEDFICENCGAKIKGTGYTNHCPNCLISKHVDINPGDRKEKCGGLMDPISIEIKNGEYVITHKCRKCGKIRKNKAADNDNIDKIIKISKNSLNKY